MRASEEGLRQVLDNLIENALEASPAGSTVTMVATGGELRVRDEGPGLSPEQREHAFDRFWRARAGAGSGLGLSIVRRLVEVDGGEVELQPAPSGGLEVVVRLKRAEAPSGFFGWAAPPRPGHTMGLAKNRRTRRRFLNRVHKFDSCRGHRSRRRF